MRITDWLVIGPYSSPPTPDARSCSGFWLSSLALPSCSICHASCRRHIHQAFRADRALSVVASKMVSAVRPTKAPYMGIAQPKKALASNASFSDEPAPDEQVLRNTI